MPIPSEVKERVVKALRQVWDRLAPDVLAEHGNLSGATVREIVEDKFDADPAANADTVALRFFRTCRPTDRKKLLKLAFPYSRYN